ncbi:hypothetical protein KR222_007906, partial [Zaprionus bogoriensis]
METPTADDLLQFRDYSPSHSGQPAQINVNSPTHAASAGSGGGSGSGSGSGSGGNAGSVSGNFNAQRQRGDPLSDLIYDMSNSAQSMAAGGAQGAPLDAAAGGGGAGGGGGGARLSFLTIEYYQQFFNVDTYMVLERIVNSMIPKRAAANYLRMNIGENPDLYGPFWITVTLVGASIVLSAFDLASTSLPLQIFSIAISGNIASYLQQADDSYHWHYNFHLVSYAATCIFLYANILPAVLWALFKYSLKPLDEADAIETDSASYTPTLLSLMCIYGYSLAIYIPVSVLWVINISLLQWLLVITAALLSGTVLIAVLTPALRNSQYSLFLIIGILSAHVVLAAGFLLYFFHSPTDSLASAGAAPAA